MLCWAGICLFLTPRSYCRPSSLISPSLSHGPEGKPRREGRVQKGERERRSISWVPVSAVTAARLGSREVPSCWDCNFESKLNPTYP